MTVSMRVMSAGDGYKYLLKTIAAADGNRPLSNAPDPLLRGSRHPTGPLARHRSHVPWPRGAHGR